MNFDNKISSICQILSTVCSNCKNYFSYKILKTELGDMVAISDDNNLHLLEFISRKNLLKKIEALRDKHTCNFIESQNHILSLLEHELKQYFSGSLKEFKTPIFIGGSRFQSTVWKELLEIPYGKTISYQEQALKVGGASYCRAVANANGKNQIAIIIPCHRVINTNGRLGGYGGGVGIKEKLIALENSNSS